MKIPELLAPAGDKNKAFTAFLYGADAVYCGLPNMSLRTRANQFTLEDLKEVINYAHQIDKKVYVVVNIFPHENSLESVKKHLQTINKLKPDALIIADAGILSLANKYCPKIEKHLSVQATTVNSEAIKFWQKNGIQRIILAREIPLKEVELIKKAVPEISLEYFVHGSMCMAYSGRCILSNYMTGRDANKGACAHSCRWKYRLYEKDAYLEEDLRRGEFFPIEEDIHGTHILSSRDMCMIEYLPEIIASQIDSLKIEGRNKTVYYLATVVRAYRRVLDAVFLKKDFPKDVWEDIHATSNRGFFAGFLNGKPKREGQQYEENNSLSTHNFVGITKSYADGFLEIEVKNRIDLGDFIEVLSPIKENDFVFEVKSLFKNGEKVSALHGGNGNGFLEVPQKIDSNLILRKKITDTKTYNFARKNK
jgi:putative protease